MARTLHVPRRDGGGDPHSPERREERRDESREPEEEDADEDERAGQLRSVHVRDEEEVEPVGEEDPDREPEARDDPVLEEEVAEDVGLLRSEGAPRADLPRALGDRERREADDAEAGHEEQEEDDGRQE